MLLALGGVLLVVGPLLLHRAFVRIMDSVSLEENTEVAFAGVMRQWWFFWSVYFTLISLAVFLMLWWRRHKTVIYNLDPDMFFHVLVDSLHSLGLHGTRIDHHWVITSKSPGGDRTASDAIVAGD